MDRRGFLKRFGAVVGLATVAPTVVHTVVKAAAEPSQAEKFARARAILRNAPRQDYVAVLHPDDLVTLSRGTCKSQMTTMAMPGHFTNRAIWYYDDPVTEEQMARHADWYDRVWEHYTRMKVKIGTGSRVNANEVTAIAEARRAVAGVRAEEALKAVAEDYLTGQTHFWRI